VQGLAGAGFERDPRIHAVKAKADASVSEATPRKNYGRARQLIVDGSPVVRTYLKFDVDLRSEDIQHVSLLLFNLRRSQSGYRVQPVYGRWGERKITFANAPEISPPYVASGPLAARSWKVVDITSLVVGQKGVSLALTTTFPSGVAIFASRETGKRGPRLVIEQQPQEASTRTTTTTIETSPPSPP
jgi:hypothetical protein